MQTLQSNRQDVCEGIDLHIDAIQTWSRIESHGLVDPDDLAQQAVLALLIAKSTMSSPMKRAYAVIRSQGAMRNTVMGQHHYFGHHRPLASNDEQSVCPLRSDERAQMSELRTLLGECMDGLEARQRNVVRMRYEEGLSNTEIASNLGLQEPHVSKLHASALMKMRDMLELRRIHSASEVI